MTCLVPFRHQVLFKYLFLFYFIHMYHLSPKLNCKLLEGKDNDSLVFIPWNTKAPDTELSHEMLRIQFADL